MTDLEAALAEAKEGQKLLFIQCGREACGNCQALKSAIEKGQVKLDKDDFVYADLNCDDPATQQAFKTRFRVEGRMLPFVVIAGSDGTQLASRCGYATPAEYSKLIKEARRAARPASHTSRGRPGGPAAAKPALPAPAADAGRE